MKQIAYFIAIRMNQWHAGRAANFFDRRRHAIIAYDWRQSRWLYRRYERECNLARKWADRSKRWTASS